MFRNIHIYLAKHICTQQQLMKREPLIWKRFGFVGGLEGGKGKGKWFNHSLKNNEKCYWQFCIFIVYEVLTSPQSSVPVSKC